MKKFAWSYSSLGAFETCPKQYYHTRIAKDVVDKPNQDALWGQRIHKALEQRIGSGTPLPDSMQAYERYAARFDGVPGVQVEQQVCLNEDMQQVEWFAKDAWCRAVFDVAVINGDSAAILDWKTGKRKTDSGQLQLSAAITFQLHPEVSRVTTSFVWLKDKVTDTEKFKRADAPNLWGAFLPRVERMKRSIEQGSFQPKPSGLCRGWCPVTMCDFYQPKR